MATAWRRVERARTPGEVRAALAASAWGDPGGEDPATVAVVLRMVAAARTAETVPPARRWAQGRAALLTARSLFVAGRHLPAEAAREAGRLLRPGAVEAASFEEFRQRMDPAAAWAVAGLDGSDELWRAEARWWEVLEQDGRELLRDSRYGLAPVVGAVAVLSADAWRVRAALELAERGGGPLEAFDALG
ncbi:hypothetical protein [Kitasatospora sp. NPDC096204]|uniref:hypothetical protein n=1 Tax=Kitasatospora sp. NPDC096204 TaxID=3364094 RepID=UPI00382CF35E